MAWPLFRVHDSTALSLFRHDTTCEAQLCRDGRSPGTRRTGRSNKNPTLFVSVGILYGEEWAASEAWSSI